MGSQVVLEFSTKMNWNLEIAADGNSGNPGRDPQLRPTTPSVTPALRSRLPGGQFSVQAGCLGRLCICMQWPAAVLGDRERLPTTVLDRRVARY